ncbi:hypothetical protein LEP1GSC166_3989 [Leptospira kirschneri]|nr:hypothetical protein LEP1GSC166_3989 [Leptospira kirschneri]
MIRKYFSGNFFVESNQNLNRLMKGLFLSVCDFGRIIV